MNDLAVNYREFVVYEMLSAFNKRAIEISCCPFCNKLLTVSEVQPSESVKADLAYESLMPVYHGTHAYSCSGCGWWSVSERWSLYEHQFANYDYLITGVCRRWDIKSWLEPLRLASEYLQQNRPQLDFLLKSMVEQEQAIAQALTVYWQETQVDYLGCGSDEEGKFNVFVINKTTISFLVILKQKLSGWINLEAVEIVNGVYPNAETATNMMITCAWQVKQSESKFKVKRHCSVFVIHDPATARGLISETPNKETVAWDKISKLKTLYDAPRPLPKIMCKFFNIPSPIITNRPILAAGKGSACPHQSL